MSRRIHLGIDAAGAKFGGAQYVLDSIVAAGLETESINRLTVFCSPVEKRSFALPAEARVRSVEAAIAERGPLGRIWWQNHGLARLVAKERCDVLLCLSGGGVAPSEIPYATLIQQSLPFSREGLATLPLRQRPRFWMIRRQMRHSAERATRVVVQTETMRLWVARGLGVPFDRISTFTPCATKWPGGGSEVPLRMAAAKSDRRVLYVGNDSPYKNVDVLLRALAELRMALPGAMVFMACSKPTTSSPPEGVVYLGYLARSALRDAYRAATVLVMPSLVETVGLPLIEAMDLGTPIVAADRPYAHDVCGESARYFDPHAPSELARIIVELSQNPADREVLRTAGLCRARVLRSARPYQRLIEMLLKLTDGAGG